MTASIMTYNMGMGMGWFLCYVYYERVLIVSDSLSQSTYSVLSILIWAYILCKTLDYYCELLYITRPIKNVELEAPVQMVLSMCVNPYHLPY